MSGWLYEKRYANFSPYQRHHLSHVQSCLWLPTLYSLPASITALLSALSWLPPPIRPFPISGNFLLQIVAIKVLLSHSKSSNGCDLQREATNLSEGKLVKVSTIKHIYLHMLRLPPIPEGPPPGLRTRWAHPRATEPLLRGCFLPARHTLPCLNYSHPLFKILSRISLLNKILPVPLGQVNLLWNQYVIICWKTNHLLPGNSWLIYISVDVFQIKCNCLGMDIQLPEKPLWCHVIYLTNACWVNELLFKK